MDASSGDDEPESHWAMELSKNNHTTVEQTMHVTAPSRKDVVSTAASSAYFMPLENTHEGDFESDAEDTFEQHFKVNKKDVKNEKLGQKAVAAHLASLGESQTGDAHQTSQTSKKSKGKAKQGKPVTDPGKADVMPQPAGQCNIAASSDKAAVMPDQAESVKIDAEPGQAEHPKSTVALADKDEVPLQAEQPPAVAAKSDEMLQEAAELKVDAVHVHPDEMSKNAKDKKIDIVAARAEWVDMWKKSQKSSGISARELHKRACDAWKTSSEREYLASLYSEPERKRRRL